MDYKKKKKVLHTLYKLSSSYSIYFQQNIQTPICIQVLFFFIIWIYFKGLSYNSSLPSDMHVEKSQDSNNFPFLL